MPETQEMNHAISARAYALWEEEGRPDGRALAHWLAAERECRARTAEAAPQTPELAPSAGKRGSRTRK